MLALGSFAFASPWLLAALIALPVIWWLLRVTPPAPRHIDFPAIRLLLGLVPREETPARTPWWLILMRTLLAALIILALAHPLLNPQTRLAGSGAAALADYLAHQGQVRYIAAAPADGPRLLVAGAAPGDLAGKDLGVAVKALPAPLPRPLTVRASGDDGALLGREAATIAPDDKS